MLDFLAFFIRGLASGYTDVGWETELGRSVWDGIDVIFTWGVPLCRAVCALWCAVGKRVTLCDRWGLRVGCVALWVDIV
jgi:hypothetical protein